ncbi:hypothetical protein Nm8I071_22090 [Nonomuraea sp. TT08I-71]|nr:hypothetical protein Nm8I071_22090 [Nonomuraea sp. TT08I-71]
MTRRVGRWTRVALRLGLLLGGVIVVWGVYEAAATTTASAADPSLPAPVGAVVRATTATRPPSGPVNGAVGLLGDVLRPVLDAAAPPAPQASISDAVPSAPPVKSGPGSLTSPARTAPSRPTANQAAARSGRVSTPTSRPTGRPARLVRTPVGEAPRPITPADRPGALTPVADALSPVTDPVRADVLGPVADALSPVTGPVRAVALVPVAGVLGPVVRPLAPVLSPVWHELEPVLDPLDPVLETLEPVTGLLDPPSTAPSVTAPPVTAPSTGTAGGPVTGAGPDGAESAVAAGSALTGPFSGPAAAGPWTGRDSTSRVSSLPRVARPDGRHPLRPDADSAPAAPTPGTSGSGAFGAVHGSADAPTVPWTPPIFAGRRCPPSSGDALASRSPRPGTRPA